MELLSTPKVAKVEAFGAVKSYKVEPTPPEEIEKRRQELYIEQYHSKGVRMQLEQTDHGYRENSGAEPLEIALDGAEWNDLFRALANKPRKFFKSPTTNFVGTDASGNTRTPAIATIQKTLDREAWKRGIILGYADVGSGEFVERTRKVKDADGKVIGEETYQAELPRDDVFELCMRTNVTKVPKRVLTAIESAGLTKDHFGSVSLND